jgi:zinc protease
MKNSLVSTAELGKAVKQFEAATFASRKTMQGQAHDLGGNWLTANDLNFSERYLAAVRRITPEDIQRVTREYLSADNRTLYALLPAGSIPPRNGDKEISHDNPIQKFTLPNGLRLLVKENHRLPFVEFRAVFEGGVLTESIDNNGITQMLGRLLLKGTSTRSAEQLATQIESLGGSLDSYGGNNSFGVNAEVLSADFATGLDLVQDVILNPIFPQAELDREKEAQIAGIRGQKDHLLQSATKAMRKRLFGDDGYGLDSNGTEESVENLNVAALKAFYSERAQPENCVLAIGKKR